MKNKSSLSLSGTFLHLKGRCLADLWQKLFYTCIKGNRIQQDLLNQDYNFYIYKIMRRTSSGVYQRHPSISCIIHLTTIIIIINRIINGHRIRYKDTFAVSQLPLIIFRHLSLTKWCQLESDQPNQTIQRNLLCNWQRICTNLAGY